mmetsp:Transcript_10086/g.26346  ORF Transcript_10086/g.26346 Transcript_10086/m.26346 type:complete len:248 (-) Transcript_10086:1297-2040(-)
MDPQGYALRPDASARVSATGEAGASHVPAHAGTVEAPTCVSGRSWRRRRRQRQRGRKEAAISCARNVTGKSTSTQSVATMCGRSSVPRIWRRMRASSSPSFRFVWRGENSWRSAAPPSGDFTTPRRGTTFITARILSRRRGTNHTASRAKSSCHCPHRTSPRARYRACTEPSTLCIWFATVAFYHMIRFGRVRSSAFTTSTTALRCSYMAASRCQTLSSWAWTTMDINGQSRAGWSKSTRCFGISRK